MPKPVHSYLQTGQNESHDRYGRRIACTGSGQDAEYAGGIVWQSQDRFQVLGGCVLDTTTGLQVRDTGWIAGCLTAEVRSPVTRHELTAD